MVEEVINLCQLSARPFLWNQLGASGRSGFCTSGLSSATTCHKKSALSLAVVAVPQSNSEFPSTRRWQRLVSSVSAAATAVADHADNVSERKLSTLPNDIREAASELGEHRFVCPNCGGGSTVERSLSVTSTAVARADGSSNLSFIWNCFRATCGWKGACEVPARLVPAGTTAVSARLGQPAHTLRTPAVKPRHKVEPPPSKPVQLDNLKVDPLGSILLDWFRLRGIRKETLERSSVGQVPLAGHDGAKALPENQDPVLMFPYKRDGKIVNCKYRTKDKKFWQVKGGEKALYGLDDIKNASTIVIVEGEVDKLSFAEAGIHNCVSVPDGAPAKASEDALPDPEADKKYEYIWNCRRHLDQVKKVILATDADGPGHALAEELARRLGREKCWKVRWPMREDGQGPYKDANELLVGEGPNALLQCLEEAEELPIRGLFKFSSYWTKIRDYYWLRLGDERGVSTGWANLDEFYRVVPGELSIVTGVPNSGKSEWIDSLMCNIARERGWTFALCSMENKVEEHARKLIEKCIGKPFFDAQYANSIPRMTEAELEAGYQWTNAHFFNIRYEDEELPSIDWVLSRAKSAVQRHGIRGLVIDPYNELDHQRPANQTETEYVSRMLTKVKRFAQHHDCHVWFVAHPKQLQVWRGEAPNLYDIAGSAHFINKCDNGLVIHRNRDAEAGPLDIVQVLVRKVRNKAAGTIGEVKLKYIRTCGRYEVPEVYS